MLVSYREQLSCMIKYIPQSACMSSSGLNQTCLCTNESFNNQVAVCASQRCTVKEVLSEWLRVTRRIPNHRRSDAKRFFDCVWPAGQGPFGGDDHLQPIFRWFGMGFFYNQDCHSTHHSREDSLLGRLDDGRYRGMLTLEGHGINTDRLAGLASSDHVCASP